MAIDIGTPNTGANHRFDPGTVGAGKEHANVSPLDPEDPPDIRELQVAIRLEASATDPELPVTENPAVRKVDCVVDTGAWVSLFQAEVARDLGLDPNDGDIDHDGREVVGGNLSCSLCTLDVYLDIGPQAIPVRVEFPVKPVYSESGEKYEWREDFLKENLLGMKSVLGKRLLCFTPDTLYAFEM